MRLRREATVKRKKDGVVLSIPLYTLEDTLKQGFEIYDEPTPKLTGFHVCPMCSREYKEERDLEVHLHEYPLHR